MDVTITIWQPFGDELLWGWELTFPNPRIPESTITRRGRAASEAEARAAAENLADTLAARRTTYSYRATPRTTP